MSKAHKGSRLKLKDQLVAVGFDAVHFDYNIDASGVHQGDIVEPSSDSVYTMRHQEGRFGGGVALEQATTNIIKEISNNSYSSYTVDGSVKVYGDEEVRKLERTDPTSVAYARHKFDMVSGNTYTGSVYMYDPYNKFSHAYLYHNGDFATSQTVEEVGGGVKRLILTGVASSTGQTSHGFLVYVTSEVGDKLWLSAPQVEEVERATSYTATSRPIGHLHYDKDMNPPFTFSCWVKSNGLSSDYLYDTRYPEVGGNSGHLIYAGGQTDGKIRWLTDHGGNWQTLTSTAPLYDGEWNHLVATINESLEKKLYINGKLSSSHTVSSVTPGKGIYIGRRYTATNPLNATISELVIEGRVYSEEEIEAMYISSKPLYNPYDYRAFSH
jgi:hypothetical protein